MLCSSPSSSNVRPRLGPERRIVQAGEGCQLLLEVVRQVPLASLWAFRGRITLSAGRHYLTEASLFFFQAKRIGNTAWVYAEYFLNHHLMHEHWN